MAAIDIGGVGGDGDDEMSRQVQVRFVTKLKAPLKAPNTCIAIPSNLTRMGLSTLVNSLLQASATEEEAADWKHEAFDFLIDGELVRMSLEQFLLAKGISAEKVLDIEYIKAVVPRKEEEPSLHDDWVSAVDGSNPRFILTYITVYITVCVLQSEGGEAVGSHGDDYKCLDHLESLEEERRKIQVFQRELPLCLDLVSQAIEKCKKEFYSPKQLSECTKQTSSEGPVLEEFMPTKRAASLKELFV